METMTIKDLKNMIKDAPDTAKVYIARDSEGNSFGTLGELSLNWNSQDEVIMIYPQNEGFDYSEINPKDWANMKEYLR